MIQLKFIGTSNANPHPDRRESGVLFTIDDQHYLFDCGDGIASTLWNDPTVCLNRIHAVFFSHRHPDHLGGFSALVLLMHQRIKNSTAIQPGAGIERNIPPKVKNTPECAFLIPGDAEQAEFFSDMLDRMGAAEFELAFSKRLYPFQGRSVIYQDKNLRIESFPTYHCMDAAGFIIQIGKKRIIYSGDIQEPKIIADIIGLGEFDVVIIECAHFKPSEVRDALYGLRIGKIIMTHQSDRFLQNPKLVIQELGPLLENNRVLFAEDNMQIIL